MSIQNEVIVEWKKTDILSKDLAEFKKSVCELACDTLAPKEVEFLKAYPEAVTQEMFLRPCAPFFDKGIENVDWRKVQETIQATMKQFYLTDISSFKEMIKPLLKDEYYLVSLKEKGKLLGFAMFAVTPALPSGTVKLISLSALSHAKEKDKLLLDQIFKILPETKRVFLYTRPTSSEEIQKYLKWGFIKEATAPEDPNHKVNTNYLLYLEYSATLEKHE